MILVPSGLWLSLGIVGAGLFLGSFVRLVWLRGDASLRATERRHSLIAWWVLWLGLSVALLLGNIGLSLFLWAVGLLGLREFHRLYARGDDCTVRLAVGVAAVGTVHYLLLANTPVPWALACFPFVAGLSLSTIRLLSEKTQPYLRATGGYLIAALLLFWGLSHFVALMNLPVRSKSNDDLFEVGAAGWTLLVVLLTEVDDIAQALVGRRWGRRKMLPAVSPGKSWEGFVGGMAVTALLSIMLVPWLSTLSARRLAWPDVLTSAGVGIIVSVAGFLGDVNISAIKREAGVKDSGALLPGMGGIMDRIDSLSMTGPAIFYYALVITGGVW